MRKEGKENEKERKKGRWRMRRYVGEEGREGK